ncbi:hypothetical protein I6E11_05655 [Bacteroides caecigallinarum]|uniref:PGN_0703 family putative restriction endonuclease n=1 Tax=Bacteroides caecigallinarum TaxID=1411144 RepID=UPI001F491709|nr:hypothetical protein [Bacteroides caecigallinarum]MCF2593282.1 hypothetical protein [Bacteroides caecigallinarum]
MDKEKIKEIIGSNLPSNIDFNFFDDILQVVLKSESVSGNMQEDSSAFEGWILCIKSVLENNDYSVKKVIIKFQDGFHIGSSPKEKQFCYRLNKCYQNYAWEIPDDAAIEANVSSLEGAVLTCPKNEAVGIEGAQNTEARLERIYIELQKKKGKTINQQLPIGLFKGKVAEVNRLTLTSFLDMWEIENDTMKIYELKAKGNTKVGIISELLYYTNMMSDILNGNFHFESKTKDYRGVRCLKESIGKIHHLQGVFLTDSLHPLISENKEKLAEAMAFVSGTVNVSFTFEKNTDDISDYNDYREKQRKHHEILLNDSHNNVFPDDVTGGGWYKGRSRSFCIAGGKEDYNLYQGIRNEVKEYFKIEHIAFWGDQDGVPNHVLSSQVACLNHLFAIREDKLMTLEIAKSITGRKDIVEMLRLGCDTNPQYISFEVVSSTDHLSEKCSSRGKYCTSIDAAMLALLEDGKKLLIMIEWKYTESYSRDDKSVESDPGRPMQPEARGITRLKRYSNLITTSRFLKSCIDCCKENELGLDDSIIPYRNSIYFQEPYYQLMRQTLWAEQIIDNKSSEKIKADKFVHIHVVPSQNKELLDNGFSGEKDDDMEKSWKGQLLDKTVYRLVNPELIVETIAKDDKYEDLVRYLRERY